MMQESIIPDVVGEAERASKEHARQLFSMGTLQDEQKQKGVASGHCSILETCFDVALPLRNTYHADRHYARI